MIVHEAVRNRRHPQDGPAKIFMALSQSGFSHVQPHSVRAGRSGEANSRATRFFAGWPQDFFRPLSSAVISKSSCGRRFVDGIFVGPPSVFERSDQLATSAVGESPWRKSIGIGITSHGNWPKPRTWHWGFSVQARSRGNCSRPALFTIGDAVKLVIGH
jgi:hypothetical protein